MAHRSDNSHAGEHASFLALAETGSFTEAGRSLGKHPTVVTKRVRALEIRLGVVLVERSTRRLRLTEAGERFARQLRMARELVVDAEREVAADVTVVKGKLRVTVPATMGRLWLADRVPEFTERHPDLHLEVNYDDGFVDLLGEGFDAAIRIGDLKDSRLVARKLADHRRILCASPDYLARHGTPAEPSDLASHNCLEFTGLASFPVWNLASGERLERVAVRGRLRSNDPTSLLAAAKAGSGILGAGEWLAARELAEGRLIQVLPAWTFDVEAGLYIVRPSIRHAPARVEAFVQWALELFRNGPPWDRTTNAR